MLLPTEQDIFPTEQDIFPTEQDILPTEQDIYCWVVLMAALAKTIFVDILVELTNTVFVNSKNMSTISTVLSTLHTSLP